MVGSTIPACPRHQTVAAGQEGSAHIDFAGMRQKIGAPGSRTVTVGIVVATVGDFPFQSIRPFFRRDSGSRAVRHPHGVG